MESALAGLFDYAGLFPPASLTIGTAVQNYIEYRHGKHAWALGCMVADANQLHAFQKVGGSNACDFQLSIVTTDANVKIIYRYLDQSLPVKMIEIKSVKPEDVLRMKEDIPAGMDVYIELPAELTTAGILQAMRNAGMRAKLRMGGITAEAFPTSASVAATLQALADRRVAFKATAGLHHPLRSRHPFTYQHDSETGMMHGFINLLCASTLLWFGGNPNEATRLLDEQDPSAWQISKDAIRWRAWEWSTEQLLEVRKHFLISIGSCSFTEPIEDLEALGWL